VINQVQSEPFDFQFPDGNIDGVPAGASRGVTNGVYFRLVPMNRGQHEIHFAGSFVFTAAKHGFDFILRIDIMYHLRVFQTICGLN